VQQGRRFLVEALYLEGVKEMLRREGIDVVGGGVGSRAMSSQRDLFMSIEVRPLSIVGFSQGNTLSGIKKSLVTDYNKNVFNN
jgi:hypothetical protein